MKTHTVPIITNGPLCGEACPWLKLNGRYFTKCLLFDVSLWTRPIDGADKAYAHDSCRHVTERAEALP